MRFEVRCDRCPFPVAFACRNAEAAEAVRDRHNTLRGHQAIVVKHLDTPFEGLL